MHPDCTVGFSNVYQELSNYRKICDGYFYLYDHRKDSDYSQFMIRQNRFYLELVEYWPTLEKLCGHYDVKLDLTLQDFKGILDGFGFVKMFNIGYDDPEGHSGKIENHRLIALSMRLFGFLLVKLEKEVERQEKKYLSIGTNECVSKSDGWLTVKQAAILLMNDIRGISLSTAQVRVTRATNNAQFVSNGQKGRARRIETHSFSTWRLEQRDKDLDKEQSF